MPKPKRTTTTRLLHEDGPGLKTQGTRRWYGGGYCGICGNSKTEGSTPLIGQPVHWWDPDDGWKFGVLCADCGTDAAARGPRRGDFAFRERCAHPLCQLDIREASAGRWLDDDGNAGLTEADRVHDHKPAPPSPPVDTQADTLQAQRLDIAADDDHDSAYADQQ